MSSFWLWLAAADLSQLRALEKNGPAKTDVGVVLGAIGAVVVSVLLWAIFFRKRRDETAQRYREHFLSRQKPGPHAVDQSNGSASGLRRKRKRRREHRQLNPTLAQTGGLPPLRNHVPTDDPP